MSRKQKKKPLRLFEPAEYDPQTLTTSGGLNFPNYLTMDRFALCSSHVFEL